MRFLTLPALLLSSALFAACGGGGGGEDGDAGPEPLPGIYVDAVNGSNATGDGSFARPFKTITRGVQGTGTGDIVRVRAGTYDALLGEVFPIIPSSGVTIVGTEIRTAFNTIRRTNVVGGGLWSGDPNGRLHATFVPSANSTLSGLRIKNPEPFGPGTGPKPAPIVLAAANVTVESCSLYESDKGVRFAPGTSGVLIKGCAFTKNGIGIFCDTPGLQNRVENCLVTENAAGVMLFAGGLDFGGGPFGSLGGNAFFANTANDFVHFTGTTEVIHAQNCFWDNAPPTLALGNPPSLANADLWIGGTGGVVTTGAQVYQPLLPFPPGGGVVTF